MRLYVIPLILLCPVIALSAPVGTTDDHPITVTYVGNCGFLIEYETQKIAIDALFGGKQSDYYDMPMDSVVALMKTAQPPFDNIRIIAITHTHVDHFDAEVVIGHMMHNPRALVYCSPQVASHLAAAPSFDSVKERVAVVSALPDSVEQRGEGFIDADILHSKHGPYHETDSTGATIDIHRNVEHLEFLFNVNGLKFLHIGDSGLHEKYKYRSLGLGQDPINLVFVQPWGCYELPSFGETIVRNEFQARHIFFMHLPPGRGAQLADSTRCPNHRDVLIPTRTLESWTVR